MCVLRCLVAPAPLAQAPLRGEGHLCPRPPALPHQPPAFAAGCCAPPFPPSGHALSKDASSFKLLDMSTKRRKAHLNKLAASKRQAQTADVAAVNLPLFAESKANQRCGKTETK